LVTVGPHSVGTGWPGLAPIAALFFGAYGGIRDGSKFAFARFQYAGLITAIGTTVVVFVVSLGIAHWYWPEEYRDIGFALKQLITDELNPFVIGAVFVTTWLLFVSGALLGTALQNESGERVPCRAAKVDPRVLRAWAHRSGWVSLVRCSLPSSHSSGP
jgi:hypothetical protein